MIDNEEDRIVSVVDKDGKEIKLYIKNPSLKDREEAESVKIRTWNRAIKNGAVFSESLNKILIEQGIWSQEKEDQISELRMQLADALDAIDKGGIKLSEAKALALKVRKLRNEINAVSFDRLKYIDNTVEGQSQNQEFNCLVANCAVYYDDRNTKYFKDYEDYLNRANDLDAYLISSKCAIVFYGGGEESYAENKFLREQKFVDDKLRLINKDGHLVDTDGKLIDELGNYIKYDEDGKVVFVDKDGNVLEKSVERKPFLDEDGKPIK